MPDHQFLMHRYVAVGKTSLMSALAGKASYGTVTGSVTINGKPDKLLRYKRVMGFVPQVSPTAYCMCIASMTQLLAHRYGAPVSVVQELYANFCFQ